MKRFYWVGVAMLAGAWGLVGCSEKPEPKVQITVGSAAPTAAPPAATAPIDVLAPRYEASLAEGIDFKRPGYPNFLLTVSGMSGYEKWARWTDAANGEVAKFRFKQALPKKLTVEISASAFGPNNGEPIKTRVGGVEKTFVIQGPTAIYTLVFETDGTADTLEFTPPKPTSPKGDPRKLGIAFQAIKIKG